MYAVMHAVRNVRSEYAVRNVRSEYAVNLGPKWKFWSQILGEAQN